MTEISYSHHINLMLNELRQARIQAVDGLPPPAAGNAGWVVYNLPDARLYHSTGSAWQLKATDADHLQGHLPAYLLARANHTGTQLAATISDLAATVAEITAYEHLQTVPQAVITVTHGLGYRPAVSMFAPDYTQQYAEFNTQHLDQNVVRVSMDSPRACVLVMS